MVVSHRRWLMWLVAFALSWATAAPAVAHFAVDTSTQRVAVCTSTGVVWLDLDTDGKSSSASASTTCDWCLTHAGGWALPPKAHIPLLHGPRNVITLRAFEQNPSPCSAKTRPWLRAPPTES